MHSVEALRSAAFEYVQHDSPVGRDEVLPGIGVHDRLGVVEHRQFDALGASTFVSACLDAFYDLYREGHVVTGSVVADAIDDPGSRVGEYLDEHGFYAYPDFYTFQSTAEPVDYHWFDIWPDHKHVSIDTDAERTLRSINDRAITTLLVPEPSASPTSSPASSLSTPSLAPESLESAARRIDTCYRYSPRGRLDDPDLTIRLQIDELAAWVEKTFDSASGDPDGVRDQRVEYWRDQLASQPLEQDFERIDLDQALRSLTR